MHHTTYLELNPVNTRRVIHKNKTVSFEMSYRVFREISTFLDLDKAASIQTPGGGGSWSI